MTSAGATTIGRSHARVGRNNQDAYFVGARTLVVADGCSAQPHSELGARLGTQFLGRWLERLSEVNAEVPEHATTALLSFLSSMCRDLSGDAPFIEEHLLFTFLAAVERAGQTMVFGMGDGVVMVDDRVTRLDSGPANAPSYCGYRLISGRGGPTVHHHGAAARVTLCTDGLASLSDAQLEALCAPDLGRTRFTLQRRLNVLHATARFDDDATLATWDHR